MKHIPKIVIVGRQNVGKSTLFNMLAKKRIAIVSPKPGVTRDFITIDIEIDDNQYELIDTGGIIDAQNDMDYIVTLKSYSIIDDADVIVFVVSKEGLMPIEYDIADYIRKSGKPVLLVINKIDTPEKLTDETVKSEFYSLGFKSVIAISAAHKLNLSELLEQIEQNVPVKMSRNNAEEEIKIAIVGKPNVGKSSILNTLIKQPRAIVSDMPGTTRDSIDTKIRYMNRNLILIDTAGIRKKARVKESLEYYSMNRAVKSIKRSDVVVLVVSATEKLSEQDKKIMYMVQDENKAAVIVFNKWDLVNKDTYTAVEFEKELKQNNPFLSYLPILFISAKTRLRVTKILSSVLDVYENYNRRITTAEFNGFIQKIVNKYRPPQYGGFIKIYYGTQIGTAPPFFALFTNKPDKIKSNYKSYIINRIRENFNFIGSPIIIKFRKK